MAVGTPVDSNVLLDVLTEDPKWGGWSLDALAEAAEADPLYINPIVYAEVSIRFSTVEAVEEALPKRTTDVNQSPGKPRSSRARCSSTTDGTAARSRRHCPISSSARTPPSPTSPC